MRLLIAAAVILLGVMAAACNDDDDSNGAGSSTLEEYFEELENINDEAAERVDAIGTPDLSDAAPFETSRDALAQYFDDYATATEDVVDELGRLEAPDEASDEHDALVGALGDLPSVTYTYANRIRDAETEDEFQTAFMDTAEGEAVGARIDDACNALQSLADENEIDVDLECGE